MLTIKAYCAGILLFEERVTPEQLEDHVGSIEERWESQNIQIAFASEKQLATEICLDVYDDSGYRHDLSTALKGKFSLAISDVVRK